MTTLYWLVGFLILLNIIDLIQTHFILSENGSEAEANIIARLIYIKSKFLGLIIYKTILISIAIIFILICKSLLVVSILIIVYICVVFWNWYVIRTDVNCDDGGTNV